MYKQSLAPLPSTVPAREIVEAAAFTPVKAAPEAPPAAADDPMDMVLRAAAAQLAEEAAAAATDAEVGSNAGSPVNNKRKRGGRGRGSVGSERGTRARKRARRT